MKRFDEGRLRAAAALLALTVACSGGGGDTTSDGDGDGGGTTTGPETAAVFCDTLYDTFAKRWADCSKAPLAWATQLIVKDELCAGLVYAVDNGKATYDRTDAGACLAFFESASCTDIRAIRDEVKYVAACHAAVTGTGASGYPFTSCNSDYECASGRCSGGTCAGYCFSGAAIGVSCNSTHDCAAGLYCHSPGYTCQPYSNIPGDGEACNFGVGCQPGLYCSAIVGGTCKPQISAGACPASTRAMAPGYGCFGGTAQPLLGAGETCSAYDDRCAPGLYCSVGNVCTQEPSVGEACAYVNGQYLYDCIGGHCGLSTYTCFASVPDPCYTDWECGGGYCISGTCDSCF